MYGFLSYELRTRRVGKNENKKETQSLQWSWFWSIRMTKFVYIIVNVGHERKSRKKRKVEICMVQCFCVLEVGILYVLSDSEFSDFALSQHILYTSLRKDTVSHHNSRNSYEYNILLKKKPFTTYSYLGLGEFVVVKY